MKIYNSMSMKVETFRPLQEGKVSMYVCGPTVYNYPHIGNARPIVVFDTLKRTLQALGYEVKMVSNYTDVDDKIINVAKELGVSEKEVTDKFIKAYNDDRLSLHAMMPDEAPRVTETMDAIIAFIDLLVQKGYAYQVGGDVYFRVGEVKEYGALSHQKTEDLVGPYELHDFYLYYMLRAGFEPEKIYRLACETFEGMYDKETIFKWLKTFYWRFFAQQFKRSCLPDGPKVGSVTLSPRGDWRMPSDACAALWVAELEQLQIKD